MDTVSTISVRRARTSDVPSIARLTAPWVESGIMLGKDVVVLYESVQEFRVAEDADGAIVGCGALHVMWEDLGEVRTLVVDESVKGFGVGHALLDALEESARELGLRRLFCLTFEVPFFERHGFDAISDASDEQIVGTQVFYELLRSPDEGIAEFLELARVKPNTLGNTRMLKSL